MAVYINLFHGRNTADEHLGDWGFDGPSLGPFSSVRYTYGIPSIVVNGYGYDFPEAGDMVSWRGKFYGDWTITSEPENLDGHQPESVELTLAELFLFVNDSVPVTEGGEGKW